MDEILTSTSAELEDFSWLSSAMTNHHVETCSPSGSGSIVSSSSTHAPWTTMADERSDHETADFFSEDSSSEETSCIKRPRKSFFLL